MQISETYKLAAWKEFRHEIFNVIMFQKKPKFHIYFENESCTIIKVYFSNIITPIRTYSIIKW